MTQLFQGVSQDFNAAAAAIGGNVVRWTYTVPARKRAILTDVSLVIAERANAANTTQATIRCTINGVLTRSITLDGSGSANQASKERVCNTDLFAGDTVTGVSVNNGAAGVVMVIDANIREYL